MEVKIHVDTKCPVPKTDLKITLENVENIGDLKKKLQPLLSVAACDMSVYYKTKDIKLENGYKLSSLYVQEGDIFIVHFVSVCNLQSLSKFLDDMRAFVEDVCKKLVEKNMVYDEDETSAIFNCYNTVIDGLDKCTKNIFCPWNTEQTDANRHYFVQEGGVQLLATIYNFASEKHHTLTSEFDFNVVQNEMERCCLSCFWSFMEITKDCLLILKEVGLEPFIYSLLNSPDSHVIESAVGCLEGFLELPGIPQIVAGNKEVLSKLFWLTSNASSVFHHEVAACTLFCCSNHPEAAVKIIRNQTYRVVLEKAHTFKLALEDYSILPLTSVVAYFFCLFLANIQCLPKEKLLPNDELQILDSVLETFLRISKPSEIGEFEVIEAAEWSTVVPFLQLALAGSSKPLETSVVSFAVSSRNVQNSDEQLYKTTGSQGRNEGEIPDISRNEEDCDKEKHASVTPYNFSPAEKMGLFCLCHLANCPKNRDLFKKEKLVDYLVCVRWFAQRSPELEELTPKLDGFERLEPPRLESIANAYLSKCFGHKIFYRMVSGIL